MEITGDNPLFLLQLAYQYLKISRISTYQIIAKDFQCLRSNYFLPAFLIQQNQISFNASIISVKLFGFPWCMFHGSMLQINRIHWVYSLRRDTLYLTHFAILTILYEYKNIFSPIQLLFASVLSCNLFAALFAMVTENRNRSLRTKLKRISLKQA